MKRVDYSMGSLSFRTRVRHLVVGASTINIYQSTDSICRKLGDSSLASDWVSVGQDISEAMDAVRNEMNVG